MYRLFQNPAKHRCIQTTDKDNEWPFPLSPTRPWNPASPQRGIPGVPKSYKGNNVERPAALSTASQVHERWPVCFKAGRVVIFASSPHTPALCWMFGNASIHYFLHMPGHGSITSHLTRMTEEPPCCCALCPSLWLTTFPDFIPYPFPFSPVTSILNTLVSFLVVEPAKPRSLPRGLCTCWPLPILLVCCFPRPGSFSHSLPAGSSSCPL